MENKSLSAKSFSKYDSTVPEEVRRLADDMDDLKKEYDSTNTKILITWPLILFGIGSAFGGGATDAIAIGVGGGVFLTVGGVIWQIDLRRALNRILLRSATADMRMSDLGWSYFGRDKKFAKLG